MAMPKTLRATASTNLFKPTDTTYSGRGPAVVSRRVKFVFVTVRVRVPVSGGMEGEGSFVCRLMSLYYVSIAVDDLFNFYLAIKFLVDVFVSNGKLGLVEGCPLHGVG